MENSFRLLPLENNLVDAVQVTVKRSWTADVRNPGGLQNEKVGNARRLASTISSVQLKTKSHHFLLSKYSSGCTRINNERNTLIIFCF